MEVIRVLRVLRPRRLLLAMGAIAALALAFALGGGESSSTGVAWTRVALDTPRSQVVEVNPLGADSLAWRASLLVHLMATESAKQRIAADLGVRPDQLAVVDPALSAPEVPASLPKAAAEAAGTSAAPYVLTVYLNGEALPIISIEAQAPDRPRAARLAIAAAAELKANAPRVDVPRLASARPAEAVSTYPRGQQAFVIEDVAPVRTKPIVEREAPVKIVAVTIFLFAVWGACVAAARTRRLPWWRTSATSTRTP